jgi:hypothetical protein
MNENSQNLTITQKIQEILQKMHVRLSQSTTSLSQMVESTKEENNRLEMEVSALKDKKLAISSLLEKLKS